MIEEWKTEKKQAENLYKDGKYPAAIIIMTKVIESLVEYLASALRTRAWAARQIGYKNPAERERNYRIARDDAGLILTISRDISTIISAIKLLLVLPDANIAKLHLRGIEEISKADLSFQEKEDLKGDLYNSIGLVVMKYDPASAFARFIEAFKTVTKSTATAGHLKHNAGTCLLMLKNKEQDIKSKTGLANSAITYLEEALEHYPSDQKGHREAVEKKITNTKREIENKFQ